MTHSEYDPPRDSEKDHPRAHSLMEPHQHIEENYTTQADEE